MILMALVAAVGIHHHFGRSEITLQNAAELLAEDLAIARHLATSSQDFVHVHFDDTGYTVTDSAGAALIHPRTGREFHRDYARDAVFEGVELDLFRTRTGAPLLFQPNGMPNASGEVYLSMGGILRHVYLMPDGMVEIATPGPVVPGAVREPQEPSEPATAPNQP